MTNDLLAKSIQQVANGESTPLSTGSYSVHLVSPNNSTYILKDYGQVVVSSPRVRQLFERLESQVAGLAHRSPVHRIPDLSQRVLEHERRTLSRWEQYGIPSPKVVDFDEQRYLLLTFEDGENWNQVINEGRYSQSQTIEVLHLIEQVRINAYRQDDKSLLHSDLHLDNILVGDSAVLIDPGVLVKDSLDLPETDAHINLFMCYALLSREFGYTSETREARLDILNQFTRSMEASSLTRMQEANKALHPVERAFLFCTRTLGNKDYHNYVARTFTPSSRDIIAQYLETNLNS